MFHSSVVTRETPLEWLQGLKSYLELDTLWGKNNIGKMILVRFYQIGLFALPLSL